MLGALEQREHCASSLPLTSSDFPQWGGSMFQPWRTQRGGEGNSTMVTEDAMHRPSYYSSCVPAHGQAESHSAKREEAAKGNPENTDIRGSSQRTHSNCSPVRPRASNLYPTCGLSWPPFEIALLKQNSRITRLILLSIQFNI